MSMMPAAVRPRLAPTTETPAERLGRLYSLRQRLELEIQAAEAMVEGQQNAMQRLRAQYPTTVPNRDRAGRRKVAVCGTDSGYHKHLRRLKEPACEPCRIAHAEAERARYQRAQESA
jgi:hypothetical protein